MLAMYLTPADIEPVVSFNTVQHNVTTIGTTITTTDEMETAK